MMKNVKKMAIIYNAGYTGTTLAAALYISPAALCRYLNATRTWPPDVLKEAAKLLDVDANALRYPPH